MHVQAPPNLSDPAQRLRLLDAGIDDWGGVSPITPDHVNPEKPWPSIEALRATTAARGKTLRERLTIYPEFASKPDAFLAGKMRAPVAALLGGDGRAVEGSGPSRSPWQDPDVRWKPRTIALDVREGRRRRAARRRRDRLRRADHPETTRAWARSRIAPERLDAEIRRALTQGSGAPTDHRRRGARAVPSRGRRARRPVPGRRRAARRGGRRRRHLRHQPQHQLHERLLRGCRFCAFAQREVDEESYTLTLEEVADRAEEAWARAPPRSACRVASTPTCRDRSTSTWSTP